MTHSPLPWTYRFRLQGTTVEPVNGEEIIAVIPSTSGRRDVDANARFIVAVAAVNAHEDLLAALEGLVSAHDEEPPMLTENEWSAARAAIAKTKGT